MVKLEDKQTSGGKRLVLGYDGGCFTCLDLAKRIDRRVGDKLEVQNLRDPRLREWRKEALGEDVPWVPTLFELDGEKVRAWTGLKMGLVLTRFLGPADTWRVMQVLGEMGAAPRVEESAIVEKLPAKAAEAVVGMSRGQFLKGVGGAAVAMSIVPGTAWLSSTAEAKKPKGQLKDATPEQREKALRIVRDSNQYKNLRGDFRRKGNRSNADFDFDNAQVKVSPKGYFATVKLEGAIEEKIVSSAVFRVNYHRETATLTGGAHYTPNVRGETQGEIKVTPLANDESSPTYPHYIVGVSRKSSEAKKVEFDYIETADGERKSLAEFKKEIERYNSQRPATAQQGATQGTITTQQYQYSAEYVQCAADLQATYDYEDANCGGFTLGTAPIVGGLALVPGGQLPAVFGAFFLTALAAGCYARGLGRPDPFEECEGL